MDDRLFEAINGLAGQSALLDAVMKAVASFGPYVLLGLVALLWLMPRPTTPRPVERRLVVYAVATAALALAFNQVLGQLWDRPRPFVAHQVTLLISASHDSSFPSDHAALGFGLALPVLLRRRDWGFALLGGALVLGFARVYVGAHYPGDIAGSFLVATVATSLVWSCRTYLEIPLEPLFGLLARLRLASSTDRVRPRQLLDGACPAQPTATLPPRPNAVEGGR